MRRKTDISDLMIDLAKIGLIIIIGVIIIRFLLQAVG